MKSFAMQAWVSAFSIFSTILLVGCEKYVLDWQMKDLCQKDGGVVVFEVEKLPPEEFNKEGIPLFRYWLDPNLIGTSQRLGPNYRYVSRDQIIKGGDPVMGEGRLIRFVVEIYRVSDEHILGRSITYARSGGDFIPLGHPTSSVCPRPIPNLFLSVFKKIESQ